MSLHFSVLAATGLFILFTAFAGCAPSNERSEATGGVTAGSEKMDAPLRRALRDADQAEDDRYDVLLGVAQETAADAKAFMTLQEDLRTAGLTIRTISGNIVTVLGPRVAIETAAADDRISSLQLSAPRSF